MKDHLTYQPRNEEELLLDKVWGLFNKYSGEDIMLSGEQEDVLIQLFIAFGNERYNEAFMSNQM